MGRDNVCELNVVLDGKKEDGNNLETSQKMTLADVYTQMEHKRELILAVIINEKANPQSKTFGAYITTEFEDEFFNEGDKQTEEPKKMTAGKKKQQATIRLKDCFE